MSATVPSTSSGSEPAGLLHVRSLSITAGWMLALIVATSTLARLLPALAKPTPTYLPDEFLYSDLARSLALDGRVALRGGPITFPALLEPLLAAPAWLVGDVELAYRLTQSLHAFAMSLAAIPAYFLVRRLGGSRSWATAGGVFAVAGPTLALSSFVTADAIGYTLALIAILLWVRAAESPALRTEAAFLVIAGLATFARAQYAAIFLAAVVSGLVSERFRPAAVRRYPLLFGIVVAAGAAGIVIGPGRLVGPYSGLIDADVIRADVRASLATQLIGLAFACFIVLVPGAVAGIAVGLLRPLRHAHLVFASFVLPLAMILVAQSAFIASTLASDRFMERYVLILPALCVPSFMLSLGRGRVTTLVAGTLALCIAVVAVRVPLSGLTGGLGRTESQLLRAMGWLEDAAAVDRASLVVSFVALTLCLVAALVVARPAFAPAAIGLAVALAFAASVAAHAFDLGNSRRAAERWLPLGSPSWVDQAVDGDVTLIATPGTPLPLAVETAFWNRSIRDFVLLEGVPPLDHGTHRVGSIRPDGTLTADDRAVTGPLLLSSYASELDLRGARLVERHGPLALYEPSGRVRVALAIDRGRDGWLAADGTARVWPAVSPRAQALLLRLVGPGPGRTATLELASPGYRRVIRLAGDRSLTVRVPVLGASPWTLRFSTRPLRFIDGVRPVGVRASEARIVPVETR